MQIIGDTKFFSCGEVAESIGVKEATVRQYIREGQIKAVKVGRSYWIGENHLREYIQVKFQIEL